MGFEPTRRFPVYSLSRGAPSTTRPRLHLRVYLCHDPRTRGIRQKKHLRAKFLHASSKLAFNSLRWRQVQADVLRPKIHCVPVRHSEPARGLCRQHLYHLKHSLSVKEEMHHIAVLDDVSFTFYAHFAGFFRACFPLPAI